MVEHVALQVKTGHGIAMLRPRISVPPVVEICVVPQALLAAHSGQVLLDPMGGETWRRDASSAHELAGACFHRNWYSNASSSDSLLPGVAIQPWFPAAAAGWAFADFDVSLNRSVPLTPGMLSRASNAKEPMSMHGQHWWTPHVPADVLAAAKRSVKQCSTGNDACDVIGPTEAPLGAVLPPLPSGLASVRVTYRTNEASGDAAGLFSGWATVECRGCMWVGASPVDPVQSMGYVGRGPAAADDTTGMTRTEHGSSSSPFSGLGTGVTWYDVDGDGQMDAIVSQASQRRFVNTAEDFNEGVVYVYFLDWRSRLSGESLEDWEREGPRVRQDVYGYGGGLGFAAYRVRRIVSHAADLTSEGQGVGFLAQVA